MRVICIFFKFSEGIEVFFPAGGYGSVDKVCEEWVACLKPASWGDAVSFVVKAIRV